MIRIIPLFAAAATLIATLPGQNEIAHHDGTSEFSSRGSQIAGATILMQRFPADQLCGTSTIVEIVTTFTDWDTSTAEMATIEIRSNDPAGPLTGQPDMTPAGLIATTGLIPVPVPVGAGTSGQGRFAFPLLVPLPPASPVGPAGDLYVAWTLPATPAYPSDGLAIQISSNLGGNAGEQMSPNTVGYSGAAGQSGLGWQANPLTGVPVPMAGDAAFAIGIRFAEDVVQPFADNPAVFTGSIWVPIGTGTGQNPNFGYAGIFPDMLRTGGPDGIGMRLRATAAIGSVSQLYVSTAVLSTPIVVLPGIVCLDPAAMLLGPFVPLISGVTQAAAPSQPPTTSEAIFGPFPGNASAAGFSLHAQCLTVDAATGSFRVSTSATIHL